MQDIIITIKLVLNLFIKCMKGLLHRQCHIQRNNLYKTSICSANSPQTSAFHSECKMRFWYLLYLLILPHSNRFTTRPSMYSRNLFHLISITISTQTYTISTKWDQIAGLQRGSGCSTSSSSHYIKTSKLTPYLEEHDK
jgi:hypothetical protein